MKVKTLFYCLIFFISYSVFSQISANRIDDFQDGSVQGWAVGALGTQPINIDDGGPSGSHDRYLQTFATASGGANSRLVIFNNGWNGDYTSNNIVAIKLHVRTIDNDVDIRIAFQDASTGTRICTTNAVSVATTDGWSYITIPISPSDFTVVAGSSTAASVLSNVSVIRILHNSSPSWLGDYINTTLELDNITASTTLSTKDDEMQSFSIYPNPGTSHLNINLPYQSSNTKVEVFNVLGKQIFSQVFSGLSTSINISKWNSGVYLIRLSNDEGNVTKRFIKQ